MNENEHLENEERFLEDDRYGLSRPTEERKSFYFDFQDWNDYEDEDL